MFSPGDKTSHVGSIVKENGGAYSNGRTSRESNSSPEDSPIKRGGGIRKSLRKPPPTGSVSKASSPTPKSYQVPISGSNTWNGRQTKQRPGIQDDTFLSPQVTSATYNTVSNFCRKNPARQSLPRPSLNGGAVQYDKNGRRIRYSTTGSLQSSPTKVANPLLEQIVQKVGHLQDERELVQKLQNLLRNYQTSMTDGMANLEFTNDWIDCNGTMALPQDNQMSPNPRKDPKPTSERGGYSRIPAPVTYKRPMSVASDSI